MQDPVTARGLRMVQHDWYLTQQSTALTSGDAVSGMLRMRYTSAGLGAVDGSGTVGTVYPVTTTGPDLTAYQSADVYPSAWDSPDDEFNTTALDTGGTRRSGAVAWSVWNQANMTVSQTLGKLDLVLNGPDGGSTTISPHMVLQACGSDAKTWKYRFQIGTQVNLATRCYAGIVVGLNATSKYVTFVRAYDGANKLASYRMTLNGSSNSVTNRNNIETPSEVDFAAPGYMEVEFDGGQLYFRVSRTGIPGTFRTVLKEATATFIGATPDRIGYIIGSEVSASSPFQHALTSDWMRRVWYTPSAATPTAFTYTGSYQTFTVPSGITTAYVFLWGAGGSGNDQSVNGGAGAFVYGQLAVTAGETLQVIVGKGGVAGATGATDAQGSGGDALSGLSGSAQGGGRSAIQRSDGHGGWTEIVTAGGGGGAGYTGVPGGAGSWTGQGHRGSDQLMTRETSTSMSGGGSFATGGLPAYSTAPSPTVITAATGAHYAGGAAQQSNGTAAQPGGGGGGWYGGGGGIGATGQNSPAGGGGSSYTAKLTHCNGDDSTGQAAIGTTAAFYQAGVGAGGIGSGSSGNGLVVIVC